MGHLVWSQLRFRAGRCAALLLGMLLATTAFTVLTAASRTSQLRTVGTVAAHFPLAYDILVRPQGARTTVESTTGTVQPNFLAGIYGGITISQYDQIKEIPGVQVAAPVAMLGYVLLHISVPVLVPAWAAARPGRQLYRYSTTWVSAAGTNRIAQPASYLYVTANRLGLDSAGGQNERLPNGSRVTVCPPSGPATYPFGPAAQSVPWCFSKLNGTAGAFVSSEPAHRPFATVNWFFPMLIAAIDPTAELRLDALNRAVTSGRYLAESMGNAPQSSVPVLAASKSGIGEFAATRVQRLPPPDAPPVLSAATMAKESAVAGQTVLTARFSAQQAYELLLRGLRLGEYVDESWTAGPARYARNAAGVLTPIRVHNPVAVWRSPFVIAQLLEPPMDETDGQYRVISAQGRAAAAAGGQLSLRLAGEFDPGRVEAFDPLSQVPLGPYQPVAAAPAGAASRASLHGGDLLPSFNLGGHVSQPVQLVTTLAALPALRQSGLFEPGSRGPISAIRVRVAGVTGPDPLSLERIKQVAQQIAVRTGLAVDIMAGSSPVPTTVDLPAGKFGRPALVLSQAWVKKGVAIAILATVDQKSVILFTLILMVCVLFVANSATAAVRGRRRELGILACAGWTRPRLFGTVLAELALLGLTAGVLGALAAVPLSAALGLHAGLLRALLSVPVSVLVAAAAGAVPAALAARADPVASVRPPVLAPRRGRRPAGITALALVNVMRTPARSLVGVLSLAVGVAALIMLSAVTLAFRGVVVGSLLGDAVALQVRGVDYVAVAATVVLGVLAVADVVFLNIRERAAELATIRCFGWRERAMARLVVTEGAVIGSIGSLAGAAVGLACTAIFAGQLPGRLIALTAGAVTAGTLISATAALVPARMLRRLPAAHLLAEE